MEQLSQILQSPVAFVQTLYLLRINNQLRAHNGLPPRNINDVVKVVRQRR